MTTMREVRPSPFSPSASRREVSLRQGLRDADGAADTGIERHRHQWRIVAIEEDSFGRVVMRECDCGIHHFITAA